METVWISVKDKLPKKGQIVDIWQMPRTQHQKHISGLQNTEYGKKYIGNHEYTGWRSTNYRFEKKEGLNFFVKVSERNLSDTTGYAHKELIVENGEVVYWMPIPACPKSK